MRPIGRLTLILLCAACATTPRVSEPTAYVRLLDVQPAIGSALRPNTSVHVRAEYHLPPDARGHRAILMFMAESGALVSAGAPGVTLRSPEGIVELSAVPGTTRHTLRRPLTGVIMITASPGERVSADTIARLRDVPPEVRDRLRQLRDSAAAGSDSLQIRTVVTGAPVPAVARSRAIFFNGAGPAPGLGGPRLPFDEVMEEYRSYRGHKAFATAVASSGRRLWGYSFGFSEPDSAIARALRECERRVELRGAAATCEIHAVNDRYFGSAGGGK